jgi:predicted RNA-binding protein associated with RNAse of E/G family
MTSEQFVIWMKGIVVASNNYNITPATWDEIKETLDKVENEIKPQIQLFPYTQVRGMNYTETRSDKNNEV